MLGLKRTRKTNTTRTTKTKNKNITAEELYLKIRHRAYQIYCEGVNNSNPTNDWLMAEKLVKEELGIS